MFHETMCYTMMMCCPRPDIAAIARGALPPTVRSPSRSDEHSPEVRRQASVQDGEAIKIVIHDVDYEPNLCKLYYLYTVFCYSSVNCHSSWSRTTSIKIEVIIATLETMIRCNMALGSFALNTDTVYTTFNRL